MNITSQAGAIDDVSAAQKTEFKKAAKPQKITKKNKQAVMMAEMAQFQQVLSHKGFVADPLSTINSHLETTVKIRNQVHGAYTNREEEDV